MLDDMEIKGDETSIKAEITFKEIVRIIVLKPTTEIDILLNQVKYKHIYLFPVLYGVIAGISKSVSKLGVSNIPHLLADSASSIALMLLYTFLFFFIYAWIVKFISNSLLGIASINMTYGLISYSMIPMIIGAIVYLFLKIFVYSDDSLLQSINSINLFIYYSQIVFVLWSFFILIIGNAFINSFTMVRSFISSTGLVIVLILLAIFGK